MATKKKAAAPAAATKVKKFTELHLAVAAAVKPHESQAEASRQFDIGKTYLSRLLSGVKENPSDATLEKMGITRHVHYTLDVA